MDDKMLSLLFSLQECETLEIYKDNTGNLTFKLRNKENTVGFKTNIMEHERYGWRTQETINMLERLMLGLRRKLL